MISLLSVRNRFRWFINDWDFRRGVSTHSFRRTALTQISNAGIPLRVIQEISLHRNLEQLQKYLEVSNEQVLGAAASLAMLSPVARSGVEIELDEKLEIDANSPCCENDLSSRRLLGEHYSLVFLW